jgi:hypothetical protein
MESFLFQLPTALRMDSSNLEEEWRFWEQKFDLFITASGASGKPEATRIAMFLHALGDAALKVYNAFALSEDERKNLTAIKAKFRDYCTPRKNVVYDRFQFGKLTQTVGETIDAFVTTLRLRAKTCEFGDQEESLIRDRVVIGCVDHRAQERLLREPDLTLQKALQICRAAEATKEQIKSLRGEIPFQPTVDVVKSRGESKTQCKNCGMQHAPRSCPAFGKKCNKCNKINHFAKVCRQTGNVHKRSSSRDNKTMHKSSEVNSVEHDEMFLGTLETSGKCWTKSFFINGSVINCKLDSGAEANVMSKAVFNKLKHRPDIRTTPSVLYGYGGNKLIPIGVATVRIRHKRHNYNAEFFVVDDDVKTLLGLPSCQQLDVVRLVDSVDGVTASASTSIIDEFADLFTGVGCLSGEHHIVVDPSVKPVIHAARRVPLALQPKLKQTLDELVKSGIIVKRDEPTDWVNSLLIIEKKNGSLRLCLDPLDLNLAIKREHYMIPTVEDIVSKLHGKRIFSIVDLKDGFWNIKIDDEIAKLCTFNTPFGRYSFCRLAFGISSSPEVFMKKMTELFGDIEGVHIVFDDIIIAAVDDADHDRILRLLFERARQHNVRFNRHKVQFKVRQVKYLGNLISADGLQIDDEKVQAITEMPVPEDKKALLRFLGMIAYISKFIPNCSALTEPLRQLNKSNVTWNWSQAQQQAFDKLKRVVSAVPVLRFFDPSNPEVTIQTDASSTGIGSCLLQGGQPIAFASRAFTEAETRYSQIEKELMAIVYATSKFNHFIYGRATRVQSDHKPLEAIFKKPISETTPRLQRMLLRLLKYQLIMCYTPGSQMHIADALSRAYLPSINEQDDEIMEDVNVMVHTLLHDFPASNKRLQEFRVETERDAELSQLKLYIRNGFPPNTSSLSWNLKQFQRIASDIYEMDGLLFVHGKIIVPSSMHQAMLSIVHEGHLGIDKCKALARQSMFWPGMSRDVELTVSKCVICNSYRKQQPSEPLLPHAVPQRPWQKIGADIFTFARKDYLLVVDYFSKYPEIALLEDKTATSVILHLKSIFARHGVPVELIADNMPFSSRLLRAFADEWDFVITTSSPTFAQSNGQSERCIQTIKNLLKKASDDRTDPYIALMQYRNAPIAGLDVSPAQLLFSRMLRTKLPSSPASLQPEVLSRREALCERQAKQKSYYDSTGTRQLPSLQPGDVVRVQHQGQWQRGIVNSKHSSPRSYIVETEHGSTLRRNRRHLIKTKEDPPVCSPPIEDGETSTSSSSSFNESTPSVLTSSSTSSPTPPGLIKTINAPVSTRSGRVVKLPVRFKDFV